MKMKLSERLILARKKAGLTQKQLSRISGVKQQTISSLELGNAKGTKNIVLLANALKVSPTWLSTGKEKKPNNTYIEFENFDNHEIGEELCGKYKNQIIDKEIQKVVEYTLNNQLKSYYKSLSLSEQINIVFKLYILLYDDSAFLKAAKEMQPNNLLKMVKN